MKTVMIISDATGDTAERMVRAATMQFSEAVQIKLYSRVRLETELEQILEKAAEQKALVAFTTVNTTKAFCSAAFSRICSSSVSSRTRE